MDRQELTKLIRSRLASGQLPPAGEYRTLIGAYDGHVCDCCDQRIAKIEYDVEIPPRGAEPAVLLAMHIECYELWREESKRADA